MVDRYLTIYSSQRDNSMLKFRLRLAVVFVSAAVLFSSVAAPASFSQSKPQRPDQPKGEGKKNQRPTPKTEEELKKEEEERKRQEEEKNATPEPGVVTIESNIVDV